MTSLQTIPGIGPAMEKDLRMIGIQSIEDLKGKSPEHLYEKYSAEPVSLKENMTATQKEGAMNGRSGNGILQED